MKKTMKCTCGKEIHSWRDKCHTCAKKDKFYSSSFDYYLKRIGVPPKTAEETVALYPQAFERLNTTTGTFFEKTFEQSAFLTGPPGSGKTATATAMILYHMEKFWASEMKGAKNRTFLFRTCPEMLQAIRYSFKQPGNAEQQLIKSYQNVDYLVLDDFGVEGTTDWILTTLYLIIAHRYEYRKTTVFTSNLTIDQLAKKFGDERITRRIADQCRIIQLKK